VVARLTEAGLMRPAGLRAFEARSEARSGVYSFEQSEAAQLPAAYRTATSWVVSAKREETRERRLAQLIECSAAGRHVPPLVDRRPGHTAK
jgi:uncharacterized protein YdeI (YjbR/CyaY-like superfamily)